MTILTEPVYLFVPPDDVSLVRALGVQWDEARGAWCVPPGEQVERFARWIPSNGGARAVEKVAETSQQAVGSTPISPPAAAPEPARGDGVPGVDDGRFPDIAFAPLPAFVNGAPTAAAQPLADGTAFRPDGALRSPGDEHPSDGQGTRSDAAHPVPAAPLEPHDDGAPLSLHELAVFGMSDQVRVPDQPAADGYAQTSPVPELEHDLVAVEPSGSSGPPAPGAINPFGDSSDADAHQSPASTTVMSPTAVQVARPQPSPGPRLAADVLGVRMQCYRCGEVTTVIVGVGIQHAADSDRRRRRQAATATQWRYLPLSSVVVPLVATLPPDWFRLVFAGAVTFRRSDEVAAPEGRTGCWSNGCVHCDALLTDESVQSAFAYALGTDGDPRMFVLDTVSLPEVDIPTDPGAAPPG